MSVVAMSVMAVLFFSETAAFARSRIVTNIAVDDNSEPQLRLNFNITLLDVHCDYVSVDVWDALGTNRQNVTRNVDKWQLDEAGAKRIFSGRNRETRELNWDSEVDLTTVEGEGEAVTTLTKETFAEFLQSNEMAFIDLYAPWYGK
jgi:Endoplasmic Reticulum-Golgi Intermediate Compartment (ERGIC)